MTNEELQQEFLRQQEEELKEVRRIQEIAEDVVSQHNIKIPIENIESVVEMLGGRVEKAKTVDDNGIIKTGENAFILNLLEYDIPRDNEIGCHNYGVAKLLGLLYIGMGFQINQALWDSQQIGKLFTFKGKEFFVQTNLAKDYYLKLINKNLEIMKSKKNVKEQTVEAEENSVKAAETYVPVLLTLTSEFTKAQDFLDNTALDITATPESIAAIGEANEGQKSDAPATIVLTTIHSAKGLEWDHVYIMDAVDGIFPKANPFLQFLPLLFCIFQFDLC